MIPVAETVDIIGVSHERGRGANAVRTLNGIDLSVSAGELVAIMGPSGSGKSTLMSIAAGLEIPTHGHVYIRGDDITRMTLGQRAEIRRSVVGYVHQNSELILGLSAVENVALPVELGGGSYRKARKAAMRALEELELESLADRFPDELSSGEVQRVTIARALVGRRAVVLADEPTSALDVAGGDAVMAVLRRAADNGVAVLFITHEARYAAWADRTIFLRSGAIADRTREDRIEDLLRGTL
ncbi:MAG: ABC transporter ATP-binding protein [Actinomycetaceae bacterium]|nr:ABC transporter ATP-binding protein [Actinomycetaceae bacterium]